MNDKTNNSQREYEKRIHTALAYIDTHLDEKINLRTLADAASFSPFHFHRIFAALLGETVGDYLRRRRVERAASRLLHQPKVKIIDLALSVGFSSPEAFTRSFTKHFNAPPTAWLKDQSRADRRKELDDENSKMSQVWKLETCQDLTGDTFKVGDVEIIEREPALVAYFRHRGPYIGGIARFWKDVYRPWAMKNRLGPHHARYGIAHSDPSVTEDEVCFYDACAEINEEFEINGGALKGSIAGGKYAVFKFDDSPTNIAHAWTALLRDWLPSSGWQMDNRPTFEYTPAGAGSSPEQGRLVCELCIPITPLLEST